MFSCKECQYVESSDDMLRAHYDSVHIRKKSNQRAVHEGIKYPCGQCGKQFSDKVDVAKHQRAVHE